MSRLAPVKNGQFEQALKHAGGANKRMRDELSESVVRLFDARSKEPTKLDKNEIARLDATISLAFSSVRDACAANGLAAAVVTKLGVYPAAKIANLKAQIASDNQGITSIQKAIAGGTVSDTDKLLLQTTLKGYQLDKTTNSQLLLLATKVESPAILGNAASNKVTARSRRNTVVIGALIGLILGAIAALLWDTVVPRITPRNGNGE